MTTVGIFKASASNPKTKNKPQWFVTETVNIVQIQFSIYDFRAKVNITIYTFAVRSSVPCAVHGSCSFYLIRPKLSCNLHSQYWPVPIFTVSSLHTTGRAILPGAMYLLSISLRLQHSRSLSRRAGTEPMFLSICTLSNLLQYQFAWLLGTGKKLCQQDTKQGSYWHKQTQIFTEKADRLPFSHQVTWI